MSFKRKIPKLAAAAVALTGCGDAAPTIESANLALCASEFNCSPDDFDFDSVEACGEYYARYYSEYLAGQPAACVDAFVQYIACAANAPCGDQEVAECVASDNAIDANCVFPEDKSL